MTDVPHEYGPSTVGHGEAQCKWCHGTNRENAIISPNHCDERAKAQAATLSSESVTDVFRYTPHSEIDPSASMTSDPNGEWVRFEDVAPELARLRREVATEYCRGRDHEAPARADAAKPIEPFRSSNQMTPEQIEAHKKRGHMSALHFNACLICNPPKADTSRCTTHGAEHRMRDELPCPWCVIDELKRNRDQIQRALDQRNELIDGYERQLGIINQSASITIGSEIERLMKIAGSPAETRAVRPRTAGPST